MRRAVAYGVGSFIAVLASALVGLMPSGAAPTEPAVGFGRPLPGLSAAERLAFERGEALFEAHVAPAGATEALLAGLGPTYNVEGCAGCHREHGRGRPPLRLGEPLIQTVVRLSVRGAAGEVLPHPAYGVQLNDRAVPPFAAEGQVFLEYRAVRGRYGDGTPYKLLQPHYGFLHMAFGRLADDVLISVRVPPLLAGLGLIEAVPEAALLALADPDDADRDGISGRVNQVEEVGTGALRVGRFGWKAGQPSLRQQVADAARIDVGLTSTLFPTEDCPGAQPACANVLPRRAPELDDAALDALESHLRLLAPPARRDQAAAPVLAGERLFADFGCAACHVARLPVERARLPAAAPAEIAPYSDLLLHDLGPGLADHRPDHAAGGVEWRTAPLWGIGAVEAVNGHTRFLHDGRARDLAEAILWHGGEARRAREAFRTAPAGQRAALLAFLNSL
jgi:CxxC motif-containing protein (DUF1111 family)